MDKRKLNGLLKCIAAATAFVLFALVVVWTKDYDKGTDDSYDIVFLGDSNFDNVRDESGITSMVANKLEKKVLNGAFGGSMMGTSYQKKTEYQSALSMYNLAISICNRNFGVQKSAIDTLARRDYAGQYQNTLDMLSKVDFDTVEILVIEHGVNDYLAGTTIKNGVDAYDTDTFCGTLRTIITMLREEYPSLRIVLVTPAYCAPVRADGTAYPCDENTYGGSYLEAYVNAELEVAKELGVEIIDLYHGIDINADNFSEYLYDGLHYNDEGRKIVADIIADYLLGEVE